MKHNLKILIGVSNRKDSENLKKALESMDGWNIETEICEDPATVPDHTLQYSPDAVFLDSGANIHDCVESTRSVLDSVLDPVFFFLSDANSEKEIIEAFRSGISDYLTKDMITNSSLSNVLKYNFVKRSYNTYKRYDVERFRTIFDQTSDGIVLMDYNTLQFIEFNDSANETLGYSQEEFSRLRLSDIELFKTKDEILAECQKIVDKKHEIYTICLKTKEGDVREVVVNSRAVQVKENTYLQCIWHDVTELNKCSENYQRAMVNLETALGELSLKDETVKIQKDIINKKNQELKRYQDLLAEIETGEDTRDGFKLAFLANLSHELRTPLNSMMLLSRLISENKEKI